MYQNQYFQEFLGLFARIIQLNQNDNIFYRWLSEAGKNFNYDKNNKRAENMDQQSEEVDVYITSESMNYRHASLETSGTGEISNYGSIGQKLDSRVDVPRRSMSADAKLSTSSTKNLNSTINEDKETMLSIDDGDDPALGQYRHDNLLSCEISVASRVSINTDNAPLVVFKEHWGAKERRNKKKSIVGKLPGWRLFPVIIKSGDDLRQEQIVSQILFQAYYILQTKKIGSWLRPYGIIATSPDSGIIEAIPDTVSLDVLRRRVPAYVSLLDFYERFFGDRTTDSFIEARENFVKSLAGYSILCYILQLKDRHNGNILIDNRGHIMHIDFGFILGVTPGGNMGFEKAPFKLTKEMVELMDGPHSAMFHKYR
jgi:phosphatidylinositol kinase/protein kinase (PI-3  family)